MLNKHQWKWSYLLTPVRLSVSVCPVLVHSWTSISLSLFLSALISLRLRETSDSNTSHSTSTSLLISNAAVCASVSMMEANWVWKDERVDTISQYFHKLFFLQIYRINRYLVVYFNVIIQKNMFCSFHLTVTFPSPTISWRCSSVWMIFPNVAHHRHLLKWSWTPFSPHGGFHIHRTRLTCYKSNFRLFAVDITSFCVQRENV